MCVRYTTYIFNIDTHTLRHNNTNIKYRFYLKFLETIFFYSFNMLSQKKQRRKKESAL